ncbi:hypothetical protein BMF94_6031, partial [Rhodotorula taiwanensis]
MGYLARARTLRRAPRSRSCARAVPCGTTRGCGAVCRSASPFPLGLGRGVRGVAQLCHQKRSGQGRRRHDSRTPRGRPRRSDHRHHARLRQTDAPQGFASAHASTTRTRGDRSELVGECAGPRVGKGGGGGTEPLQRDAARARFPVSLLEVRTVPRHAASVV